MKSELGELDWLKQWSRFSPTSIAFKDGDSGTELSYSELYYLSCKLAAELSNRYGVRRGDRIAMLATNEIEAVALFFAVLRLGAILVPINYRLTAREIEHVLNDSGVQVLTAQSTFQTTVDAIHADVMPKFRWAFEDLQKFTSDVLSFYRLADRPTAEKLLLEAALPTQARDEEPCMILYTSGTTGAPKGAMVTPKMLHWNSLNTTLRLNLSQSDVFVNFLPFFHTGGWNVLLTPFVHRGAKIVLLKKFDADRVLSLCETEGATIMFGVPTTMELMARSSRFSSVNLSKVRYAIVGGEPMPIDLIKIWQDKGVPIRQGFGLTEFGPNVFSLNEEDAIRKIGSIGFTNFYVKARVVDDEGRDVKQGEIGELILQGPVCTPGYWRNELATREAIRDGWFYTGDLVRYDEEGYFYVSGRKKDMFISGGENVYPVEVERVLSQHPAVREVAVVGVPDAKWGEVGRAYVSLHQGGGPDLADTEPMIQDLLRFCADKLAKFKIPKQVEFMLDLPKGDSGKILKRALKDLAMEKTAKIVTLGALFVTMIGCQSSRYREFETLKVGMDKSTVVELAGGPQLKDHRNDGYKGTDRWLYYLTHHPDGPRTGEVRFENGIAVYVGPRRAPMLSAAQQDDKNAWLNAYKARAESAGDEIQVLTPIDSE